MGSLQKTLPVKLFLSIFTRETHLFEIIQHKLISKFGPVDFSSEIIDFNHTQYYEKEFGINLKRNFISFRNLIKADNLWKIKIITNKLESKFSKENKRRINLDPGYITQASLVLASTKNYSHRIYIKKGIYQEVSLIFKDKTFTPLPWTYPDYQTKECIDILIKMRDILNLQLKSNTK